MKCGTIVSGEAGQWATAPSLPRDHKGKQLIHLQPFRTQTTILFLTCSKILKKLHEIFNTLL